MTLEQAAQIIATIRSATQVELSLVQPAHGLVDIVVGGVVVRCSADKRNIYVGGQSLISFFMPRPQWFDAALASGAYESADTHRAWQRVNHRRSLEVAAERAPEGIEADAADRF